MPRDHVSIGHQYAVDIVSGVIPACGWVWKACNRHLDDLAKQGTPAFPYRFDETVAGRVCRFIELFEVYEGPLAGKKISLLPWQCWLLTTLYGWLNDRGQRQGKRRFRRAYIEIPRGNGKSALSSALGLYMLAADGEGGAQVVAAGTSRDVAKIVFGASQTMAKQAPDLMRSLDVEVTAHAIIQKRTASNFKSISADARTADGKNLHGAIIDELHLHRDRRLYDSLETGTAKRDQSLLITITTAGTDVAGICYEVRSYLTKILDQLETDESTFGIIYTLPEDMDWRDPLAWEAANPSWGVTVMPEVVEQHCKKAQVNPAAQNNFRTKHLCQWMSADNSWMDMSIWRKSHDPSLSIEDYEGQSCYIGLDLSSKLDLCSKAYLFPNADGTFAVFTRNYLPENVVHTSSNSQYKGWEITGDLITTPGDVTDYSIIENDILDDMRKYDVLSLGYDPKEATYLVTRLIDQDEDLPLIEVHPSVANLSEPMKELQALVIQKRIIHNDPVLSWAVSNTLTKEHNTDNQYPRKLRPEDKIDPVVALITAIARYIQDDKEKVSIYEYRPLLVLG